MRKDLILIAGMSTHLSEIVNTLRHANVNVVHAESVYDVKAGLEKYSPAFVLLDYSIAGAESLFGKALLESCTLRPYVIVAAIYADGNDRAAMLKRGADYCIEKPANANEVLAVMDAVLRRNRRTDTTDTIRYEELTINMVHRLVTMRGEPITLTCKEYEVLCFLVKNAGTVLTKEKIYCAVWKNSYDPNSTNVADQISSLRLKLGLDRRDTTYIQTVIGVGYRFGTSN